MLDRMIHCIIGCDVISKTLTEQARYGVGVWWLFFDVMYGLVMPCMKWNNVYMLIGDERASLSNHVHVNIDLEMYVAIPVPANPQ